MKSYQEFFAELKRRKVFRVAGIYGIVSFGVLQAADLMLPRLGVPDWTVTFMVALVVLAFPVALILAWAFEVTPEGVRKTEVASEGEIEGIIAEPISKRWPAGLLALVGVVALVASTWWIARRTAPDAGVGGDGGSPADVRLAFVDPADDPRPSIAVLPFDDLSPDGDQAYFSDGMTEEILNVLAQIRDLRVAARTSTFALRDSDLTAPQWGDTLGVSYLVEGSVRKSGDMLRITAQLIDTSNGSHLWSDNFDRPLANVFEIHDEVAARIAEALTVPLGLEEGETLTTPTADLEAYDLYLAGRQQMRRRGSGVAEAVTLFEAAIARDSTWAPAWAGLAESRALVVYHDDLPNDSTIWAENLGAAEQAAHRALDLDPDNASALVALGNVYRDRWEWDEAEATYLRALAVDPDNVEAHQGYAEFLGYIGRNFEAVDAARRAVAMDRTPMRLNIAGFLTFRIDPDAGIELFKEGIQADTDGEVTEAYIRANLRQSYALAGRWEDYWQPIADRNANDPNPWTQRFLAYWPEAGPPPRIAIDSVNWRPGVRAMHLALMGHHEDALKILEEGSFGAPFGGSDFLLATRYDPIRDDPRFQALLRERGLEGVERQDAPPEED